MLAITRQDIINDDLGALTSVPRRIGRGAALKLNNVFWTEFLDDASFFNTDGSKGNYIDGASTALSLDGLDEAQTAFKDQTDPDGNPLGLTPRILLVPNELEMTAFQLMNSTALITGENATQGAANVFRGRYNIVSSSYLTAPLPWYLLADPQDMPVIEVAFLNGQRMPTVETADADFNTLGVQMRGFFDFGVSKQEY